MSWPPPNLVIPPRPPEPGQERLRRLARTYSIPCAILGALGILVWATYPWWAGLREPSPLLPWVVLIVYGIVLGLAAVILPIASRPHCPNCHRRSNRHAEPLGPGFLAGSRQLIYRCDACHARLGYQRTSDGKEHWDVVPEPSSLPN